jgi:retron-type reverse transcriptase
LTEAKPYSISKHLVLEAWWLVRANRGAAGVDGESLAIFEKDLKGNLYKIWNRMSSGSYFPPPVRLVEIPKGDGKLRPLGIPTVSANCTGLQFGFGMGGDPPSISPASRSAV